MSKKSKKQKKLKVNAAQHTFAALYVQDAMLECIAESNPRMTIKNALRIATEQTQNYASKCDIVVVANSLIGGQFLTFNGEKIRFNLKSDDQYQ